MTPATGQNYISIDIFTIFPDFTFKQHKIFLFNFLTFPTGRSQWATHTYFLSHFPSLPCRGGLGWGQFNLQFLRTGNPSQNRRSRRHSRISQISLGCPVSHSTHKISISSGNTSFFFRQNPHMPANTGTTSRSRKHTARFNKNLSQTFLNGLFLNPGGTWNHNHPDFGMNLTPFENRSCPAHILNPAVGTGSYYNRINRQFFDL